MHEDLTPGQTTSALAQNLQEEVHQGFEAMFQVRVQSLLHCTHHTLTAIDLPQAKNQRRAPRQGTKTFPEIVLGVELGGSSEVPDLHASHETGHQHMTGAAYVHAPPRGWNNMRVAHEEDGTRQRAGRLHDGRQGRQDLDDAQEVGMFVAHSGALQLLALAAPVHHGGDLAKHLEVRLPAARVPPIVNGLHQVPLSFHRQPRLP
mmetsp:Transcript_29612/g.78411  ORF Transcript_29612/g.78411 Transcript_29612/m.78411 type:complete len:204 (-) Transcript_29612:1684-2295(-)